ncbi:hypothetical protein LP420_10735 [Massilia sp. B-10]|nr:hypothetical protein LP420_10735 [Massilia sp. B-10]
MGGKTGTGDQRFEVYGAGGRLIESRFVNRSATFVFNIGERFYGSMTAYVHGPKAGDYDFTSAAGAAADHAGTDPDADDRTAQGRGRQGLRPLIART